MLQLLALMAAAPDPAVSQFDMNAVPIDPGVVQSANIPIPVSDSVRAATWDELGVKPTQPKHIHVACVVLTVPGESLGIPGSCAPAGMIEKGAVSVDWGKVQTSLRQLLPTANPRDVAMFKVVSDRLGTARVLVQPQKNVRFVVQLYEEVVSPDDARPAFVATTPLLLNDVQFVTPINPGLVSELYPTRALARNVTAQVSMICNIQANQKLLCRDPGNIVLANADQNEVVALTRDFRFATYQLAASFKLAAKGRNGVEIAGKQLKFAIRWQIPAN